MSEWGTCPRVLVSKVTCRQRRILCITSPGVLAVPPPQVCVRCVVTRVSAECRLRAVPVTSVAGRVRLPSVGCCVCFTPFTRLPYTAVGQSLHRFAQALQA